MRLFCKCPLPEVGSPDWPWEDQQKPVLLKVSATDGWGKQTEGFIEIECTPASMPGYVVSCKVLDRDGFQVLGSRAETSDGYLVEFWEGPGSRSCEKARRWCEQDARQQWVRQNLLTMVECGIGANPKPDEPKVVPWLRQELTKRKPKTTSKNSKNRTSTTVVDEDEVITL